MTFCIITHVSHGINKGNYYAYSPYVREMNIWSKYIDKIILVAPLTLTQLTEIESFYTLDSIDLKKVNEINFLSVKKAIASFLKLPKILIEIFKAMQAADHIHIRCPGNMGLLGCILQIFFPTTKKTAKYAGNWDSTSKQPLSYRIQKWILSNTFLTKNMQVLVYGNWENNTENIKPFFTASYSEKDKIDVSPKILDNKISFLFVGTLTKGKEPLYAIQLIEHMNTLKYTVELKLYGEGAERGNLERYILEKQLEKFIFLMGNHNQHTIKSAYIDNHFIILPSQSEGWPKVIAEAMFWGCLPIATKVSCVPDMLDHGERGVLLEMNFENDIQNILTVLENNTLYQEKTTKAIQWSRQYTLDVFESEIKNLIQS